MIDLKDFVGKDAWRVYSSTRKIGSAVRVHVGNVSPAGTTITLIMGANREVVRLGKWGELDLRPLDDPEVLQYFAEAEEAKVKKELYEQSDEFKAKRLRNGLVAFFENDTKLTLSDLVEIERFVREVDGRR